MYRQKGCGDSGEYDTSKYRDWKNILVDFLARCIGTEDNALNFIVDSPTCAKMYRLGIPRQIVKIGLEEPKSLECRKFVSIRNSYLQGERHTSRAEFTDSSQRSNMNSSNAMDSLSTDISRWQSCGRKNSSSS